MAIKIISPGLATSVQDLGRPGYFHLGIPISGGMNMGSLLASGLPQEVTANKEVIEAYLGLGEH